MSFDPLLKALLPEDFDQALFLREYWQQKPLLIRGRRFRDPITPEALAGLACEPFIDARLVHYQPGSTDWQLEHGPFEESTFRQLPADNYSLLVQSVDSWHPGVRQVAHSFSLIPGWRRDDVMVSYATPGGNVGPHVDQYDVFLVQGLGRKRWLLGDFCDEHCAVDDSSGLRLLRDFQARQTHDVECGDILYLPPGIAHHGIAQTPAITYSVGFRAPSLREILGELAPYLARELPESARYRDVALLPAQHPAQIPAAVSTTLAALFRQGSEQALQAQPLLQRWFGEYMTAPRHAELLEDQADINAEHDLDALLEDNDLVRNPLSRFAFADSEQTLQLFVDGQSLSCEEQTRPLVLRLCDEAVPLATPLTASGDAERRLLRELLAQGSLMARHDLPEDFLAAD